MATKRHRRAPKQLALDLPPAGDAKRRKRQLAKKDAPRRRNGGAWARQPDLGFAPPAEPGEEWRPCPSWPAMWGSSHGRIGRAGAVLRTAIHRDGYAVISSTYGCNRKRAALVADAFHGPRPAGAVVRHLDGTRDNDSPSNLRWGTHSENARDAIAHGTRRLVLDETKARTILAAPPAETDASIARRLGTYPQLVTRARTGASWCHIAPEIERRARMKRPPQEHGRRTRNARTIAPPE